LSSLASDHDTPTSTSNEAGILSVYHQTWLICWDRVLMFFALASLVCVCVCVCVCGTGAWIQGLYLKPLHQPYFFYSFIHMCIHCLGHFSLLPLAPPSIPTPPALFL
jgi:hypothetical protein